jgi:hypothetical protein
MGSFLTKESLLSFLRHFLTFVGGFVVAQGWISPDALPEVIGAVMTIAGLVFSFISARTKTTARAVEKAVEVSPLVDAKMTSDTKAVIVAAKP